MKTMREIKNKIEEFREEKNQTVEISTKEEEFVEYK